MIRWVSSEIRVFAYLKNFVLVACFLGFDLGCYLCRRRVHLFVSIGPLLLLTVVLKSLVRRPPDPIYSGAPAGTRTLNPQIRNLMLYPVELRAHKFILRDLRLAKPAFVAL